MVILGISCFYHDAAAALLIEGKIVAAAAEERFSRKKHDNSFPAHAIAFCMTKAGLDYKNIDYVVFYEKPFVKFERILRTHIQYFPFGLSTFNKAIPIWIKERIDMQRTITKELRKLSMGTQNWDIRFVEHHISHASMAYHTSGFNDAAILVVDAVGERATNSIMYGHGDHIKLIKQQYFPHSIGLLYSSVTYYLGFKVNSDEYKVMGLAPYGIPSSAIRTSLSILVNVAEDGSILLNEKYFTFMYGLRMVDDRKWEKLFGFPRRKPEDPITDEHKALAAAIQNLTEVILLRLARHAKELTGSDRLCVAGGCALNCAAMGYIRQSGIFKEVYVPFAPGDDGCAIGAALYLNAEMFGNKYDSYKISPYLGPSYSEKVIEDALIECGLTFVNKEDTALYECVSTAIANGEILGWYQEQMEFGPRALGNRSILADPRRKEMKDIINAKVKFRESFRPFAPIIMEEFLHEYFECEHSPYMMFTAKVRSQEIPAVTHIDGSARIQSVSNNENPRIHALLDAFRRKTSIPVLLNTSFNVMGEPIVCSPTDAINAFKKSGLNMLVINNYIVYK